MSTDGSANAIMGPFAQGEPFQIMRLLYRLATGEDMVLIAGSDIERSFVEALRCFTVAEWLNLRLVCKAMDASWNPYSPTMTRSRIAGRRRRAPGAARGHPPSRAASAARAAGREDSRAHEA